MKASPESDLAPTSVVCVEHGFTAAEFLRRIYKGYWKGLIEPSGREDREHGESLWSRQRLRETNRYLDGPDRVTRGVLCEKLGIKESEFEWRCRRKGLNIQPIGDRGNALIFCLSHALAEWARFCAAQKHFQTSEQVMERFGWNYNEFRHIRNKHSISPEKKEGKVAYYDGDHIQTVVNGADRLTEFRARYPRDEIFSTRQLADYLKVSVRSIYQKICRGTWPFKPIDGSRHGSEEAFWLKSDADRHFPNRRQLKSIQKGSKAKPLDQKPEDPLLAHDGKYYSVSGIAKVMAIGLKTESVEEMIAQRKADRSSTATLDAIVAEHAGLPVATFERKIYKMIKRGASVHPTRGGKPFFPRIYEIFYLNEKSKGGTESLVMVHGGDIEAVWGSVTGSQNAEMVPFGEAFKILSRSEFYSFVLDLRRCCALIGRQPLLGRRGNVRLVEIAAVSDVKIALPKKENDDPDLFVERDIKVRHPRLPKLPLKNIAAKYLWLLGGRLIRRDPDAVEKVSRRETYSVEIRERVVRELEAGKRQCVVAKEFNIPSRLVQGWDEMRRKKSADHVTRQRPERASARVSYRPCIKWSDKDCGVIEAWYLESKTHPVYVDPDDRWRGITVRRFCLLIGIDLKSKEGKRLAWRMTTYLNRTNPDLNGLVIEARKRSVRTYRSKHGAMSWFLSETAAIDERRRRGLPDLPSAETEVIGPTTPIKQSGDLLPGYFYEKKYGLLQGTLQKAVKRGKLKRSKKVGQDWHHSHAEVHSEYPNDVPTANIPD